MKSSRSEYLEVNGARVHVRRWGDPEAPPLMMLHGWMDISATFQFVVDAFARHWNILAPDWPGFGKSADSLAGYSLLQYATDLDRLLDHYSPHSPLPIVGHSMGANITNLYAPARPGRISHFVNIEGYAPVPGFFDGSLGQVIGRWLDHQANPSEGRAYSGHDQLAERLMTTNPRLAPERAQFLAEHLGMRQFDGSIRIAADPATRFISPISLHAEQLIELWRDIHVPVLCIRGGQSFVSRAFDTQPGELPRRLAALANGHEVLLPDGSHNLHHELPGQVAALIEQFLP